MLLAGLYVSGKSTFVWPNLQNLLSTGGYVSGRSAFVWPNLQNLLSTGGYASGRSTFVWHNLQNLLSTGGIFLQEHICFAKIGGMSAYTTCLRVDYVSMGLDSVGLG